MDSERAADALKKMMRAFQSELSFGDYMDAVGTVSFAALAQTADNFRTGSVPKQSMKRAPFPAEFAQEARRVDENIKTRARAQSLPAPKAEEIFQVSDEERARVRFRFAVRKKAEELGVLQALPITPAVAKRFPEARAHIVADTMPAYIEFADRHDVPVPDTVRAQL